jgi:hypothetical protein
MIVSLKEPKPLTNEQHSKYMQNVCDTVEFYLPDMADSVKEIAAEGKHAMFIDASQQWDPAKDSCTLLGMLLQYGRSKGVDICITQNFDEVKERYYARLEEMQAEEEAEEEDAEA